MELKDYLVEGKLDEDGINKLHELIEENKKLKDSFCVSTRFRNIYIGQEVSYFSKEDFDECVLSDYRISEKAVESLKTRNDGLEREIKELKNRKWWNMI